MCLDSTLTDVAIMHLNGCEKVLMRLHVPPCEQSDSCHAVLGSHHVEIRRKNGRRADFFSTPSSSACQIFAVGPFIQLEVIYTENTQNNQTKSIQEP